MRATASYKAENGKVHAYTPDGKREVETALTANGRDLERFEKALNRAREQRETIRNL